MKKIILEAAYTGTSYEEKEALKALDNDKHTSLDDDLVFQLGGPLYDEDVEISDTGGDNSLIEIVNTEDIRFKEDIEQQNPVLHSVSNVDVKIEDAFDGYDVTQKDGETVFSLSNNLFASSLMSGKNKKRKIKEKKYRQIDPEIEDLYGQFKNHGYYFEYDIPVIEEVRKKSKKVCEDWNAIRPKKSTNGPRYIKKIRNKKK